MKRGVRILSVLFALVCLALSGFVLHVTDGAGGEFYKAHGVIGTPFSLDGAEVTVRSVTVGHSLTRHGDRKVKTPGLFVRLDVEVACTTVCRAAPDKVVLRAGDRTYRPWQVTNLIKPAPGYRTLNPLVFEVDPADLGGLVAEISQTEYISGYQAHGWVDLRLASRADQLRRTPAEASVDLGTSSTEVIA